MRTGDRSSLDEAVRLLGRAADTIPPDHPDQAVYLSTLAAAMGIRFEWTGAMADLDGAVDVSRRAVAATPADHPARAATLANLGVALTTRFKRAGVLADLNGAVDACRAAVDATLADDPDRAMNLSNLGVALDIRFERAGVLADLDAAVDVGRAAVDATPADHPDRAVRLLNLGSALRARFERTGVLADVDGAVDVSQRAVDVTPAGHPNRALYLSNLGSALGTRFRRTGVLADVDGAVDACRAAVDATPADRPDRARSLLNLACSLEIRFERTGFLADLDGAVDACRAAVDATPADHPDRTRYLSTLSIALRTRFERTGMLADLDGAVDASRAAVDATPADHPYRIRYLSALSNALTIRFERTGVLADVDAAVDASQRAVDVTPVGHPDRALYLSNLGGALITRFGWTGVLADLDAAVDVGRAAVDTSPADHPDRAVWLSTLGSALTIRFKRTGVLADVDAAVDAHREAVDATMADHPDRALYLSNLSDTLQTRFERTGQLADLDAALDAGRGAVGVEVASPRVRANAARAWGWAAAVGGRWEQAVEGFAAAAGLLGELAPRDLSRSDQEGLLTVVGGLGADGAACAVRAGDPARAVELFEQGRGVLLGQVLDTRGDLSELQEKHEALYDRFAALAANLDRPETAGPGGLRPAGGETGGRPEDAERLVRRRRALCAEFDRLVEQIRGLPGFAGFLRPPPLAELTRAAAGGPVVVVAVSRFGSYALVLTKAGVAEPVALAGLTPEAVVEEVVGFLSALDTVASPVPGQDERERAEVRLSETLGWLWDRLAGPVLDHVASLDLFPASGVSGGPLRVWWCLSGLLSFLPVHAAGRHETRFDPRPCTVTDRVVSSYTPTLRALIHARRTVADQGVPPSGERVAAVAMPRTPGERDLRWAEAELAALRRHLPGRVSSFVGPEARWETVHVALRNATWAHFACHGYSDLAAPSSSRLLLHDHRDRPFTVVDVARLRLDHAHLAYLSACSTARPSALADEAIHLASAFQLAGYRHVIGTLWPIDDNTAVGLADEVYAALTGTDPVEPAVALSTATRRLRNLLLAEPSRWASHVHSGI